MSCVRTHTLQNVLKHTFATKTEIYSPKEKKQETPFELW